MTATKTFFTLDRSADITTTQTSSSAGAVNNILALVEAGLNSNFNAVRQVGQALMVQSGGMADPAIARRFNQILRGETTGAKAVMHASSSTRSSSPLVEETPWPSSPIFLEPGDAQFLQRFIDDAKAYDQLVSAGLNSKSSLIIQGSPGTGKTLAAGHIAARLGIPLYVVRLDTLISSYLGDTARNIRQLFDYFQGQPGLLFLDEFDAIAKTRDDNRDVGELKRVVNTILQCIDFADPRMVTVAATNHASLLDHAIWRRFPYKLTLNNPGQDLRATLWEFYLELPSNSEVPTVLAKMSDGMSCADIVEFARAAKRDALLRSTDTYIPGIATALIELRNRGYAMPSALPIDEAAGLCAWKLLREKFDLVPSEIACLWSTAARSVEDILRASARNEGREDGTQTGSAPRRGTTNRVPRRTDQT